MGVWANIEFQGKTYGLKNLNKKRRNKSKTSRQRAVTKALRKNGLSGKPSEGQMVQRDFEIMIESEFLGEKTKLFLKKLRGSYDQFKRFTPKQFSVFKKIWWQMKDKQKGSVGFGSKKNGVASDDKCER